MLCRLITSSVPHECHLWVVLFYFIYFFNQSDADFSRLSHEVHGSSGPSVHHPNHSYSVICFCWPVFTHWQCIVTRPTSLRGVLRKATIWASICTRRPGSRRCQGNVFHARYSLVAATSVCAEGGVRRSRAWLANDRAISRRRTDNWRTNRFQVPSSIDAGL